MSEIEVQASRASSLMGDLKRIVPDVELAMGPLLKVRGGEAVVLHHVYYKYNSSRIKTLIQEMNNTVRHRRNLPNFLLLLASDNHGALE